MNGETVHKLRQADVKWSVATGLLSLALYLRTLAPGLLPADSGEFQVLGALMGNTHPTGYPVYILLARLFTWLPIRDIAYRINLLSAVMGSLTVAGVYLTARLLGARSGPALFGALALAVCPSFWSQAVIAEVYTPGVAFLVAVLICLLLWDIYDRPLPLFAAGLLGGLSLGVHLTVALVAPAVAAFLFTRPLRIRAALRPALFGTSLGVALTLGTFLALEWHNPAPSYFNVTVVPGRSAWGLGPDEIDGPLERLAFNLSGRQFHSLMFTDPPRVMPRLAAEYWQRLPHELSWVGMGLAILGLISLAIRRWRAALLFFLALAVHWGYTFNYDLWDLFVFYIPGYLILATLAGVGLSALVELTTHLISQTKTSPLIEMLLTILVLAVGVWPTLAPYRKMVYTGRPQFDTLEFEQYIATDYAMDVVPQEAADFVRQLKPNAIVFTDWYWAYPFYYAAYIEQGRTDLTFIETIPQIEDSRLPDSAILYVRERLDEHPIYFFEHRLELVQAGFALAPVQIGSKSLYQVRN